MLSDRGFTLVELLVVLAVVAVLLVMGAAALSSAGRKADQADALTKIHTAGGAILSYPTDHNGALPPLFPGQVMEYEEGRGGRIVTECAEYLGIGPGTGKFLVLSLMPRSYAKLSEPADHNAMRVYVMNTSLTNADGEIVAPFGKVVTGGSPPTGNAAMARLAGSTGQWMLSTADRKHANVAGAPWKDSAPASPPLGDKRAVFRFDGSAALEQVP